MFDALNHCVTAVNVLRTAVKIIAEHTMREGAGCLKQENNGSRVNTVLSVDGS